MSVHVSTEALEAYVIGALDEAELSAVEAHVLECPACEARLQHEASLDLAFTAVARQAERPRKVTSFAGPLAAAGGALAMAAAIMLWVLPHGDIERAPSVEEPAPIATEINADASTATAQLEMQADGASRVGVRD